MTCLKFRKEDLLNSVTEAVLPEGRHRHERRSSAGKSMSVCLRRCYGVRVRHQPAGGVPLIPWQVCPSLCPRKSFDLDFRTHSESLCPQRDFWIASHAKREQISTDIRGQICHCRLVSVLFYISHWSWVNWGEFSLSPVTSECPDRWDLNLGDSPVIAASWPF